MSLLKSGVIVGFLTLVSRILGYIRDVFIASYLGTGSSADAFAISFKLPNFFRTIFAEGAFSSSFVPIFAGKYANQGKTEALKLANIIFSLLFIILFILIILFQIFMPSILKLLAPGFINDSDKFDLCIFLSRITFPYLIFISLSTMIAGILNSIGKFATASILPILLNLTMIITLISFKQVVNDYSVALALGVLIAGIIQLSVIYLSAIKEGIYIKFVKPEFSKEVIMLFKNMIPAIIGSSITQINLWVGTIIATNISGAVSVLYYAERLNQFPLAIIGIAISTILLPSLSKYLRTNNTVKANLILKESLDISLFLTLPCCSALLIIGDLIISVLFERNAFTETDSINVSAALSALVIGLPAFIMIKIFTPRFFAELDTKTPVKISCFTALSNLLMAFFLGKYYSFIGIALASAIAGWINAILLLVILIAKKKLLLDYDSLKKIIKIILSCSVMSFVMYNLKNNFLVYSKPINLLVIIVAGSSIYIASAAILKIYDLNLIKSIIGKK